MKTRKPVSWFKREAAIMVLIPIVPIVLGFLIFLFVPVLLHLSG